MLKLLSSLPFVTGAIAIIFLVLFGMSIFDGRLVWSIPTGFAATVFGLVSYVGFRLQRKINAVTDTVTNLVGEQAEKVADAIVERVRKV